MKAGVRIHIVGMLESRMLESILCDWGGWRLLRIPLLLPWQKVHHDLRNDWNWSNFHERHAGQGKCLGSEVLSSCGFFRVDFQTVHNSPWLTDVKNGELCQKKKGTRNSLIQFNKQNFSTSFKPACDCTNSGLILVMVIAIAALVIKFALSSTNWELWWELKMSLQKMRNWY